VYRSPSQSLKSYDSLVVIGSAISIQRWNFATSVTSPVVAHYLNYSEATRRLHVAQPAISQTILDLEDELGVKLLFRTKRIVQLTAARSVHGEIVGADFRMPVGPHLMA